MTFSDSRKPFAVSSTPRFSGYLFSALQSQLDCALQPWVGELASLPWVGGRAHLNPFRVQPRTLIGVYKRSKAGVLQSAVIE